MGTTTEFNVAIPIDTLFLMVLLCGYGCVCVCVCLDKIQDLWLRSLFL